MKARLGNPIAAWLKNEDYLPPNREADGRAGGIRTHGLFVPNEAHYQAVLQPADLTGPLTKRGHSRSISIRICRCKGIVRGMTELPPPP